MIFSKMGSIKIAMLATFGLFACFGAGDMNPVIISSTDDMSLDSQQTIVDMIGLDALTSITSITPLYRLDLLSDYIAYYEVVYSKEYAIVSAGSQTGDNGIISTGILPMPTDQLEQFAKEKNMVCATFYVLTSSGDMMCKNKEGVIVATTIPDAALLPDEAKNKRGVFEPYALHDFIISKNAEQAELWRRHAQKIRDDEGWDDSYDEVKKSVRQSLSVTANEANMAETIVSKRDESFIANSIIPGETTHVVTGKTDKLEEIRLRYLVTTPEKERVAGIQDHKKLCKVVIGCEKTTENYAILSSSHVLTHSNYIDLELDINTKKKYKGEEFVFAVDIVKSDKTVITRNFAVYYAVERKKRGYQYTSWGAYTYWGITYESYFPDYNQFTYSGCAVGCGPVAWAMVFGYYDRRDHYSSLFSGSTGLYRSGFDGTYGSSSQVAPTSWTDTRVKRYIQALNNILGTFCLFSSGATLSSKMTRISSFFTSRQTTGSPAVSYKRHFLYTLIGVYSDTVEDWARDRLKAGWPVIIGWRAGSYLSWHYPVATRLAGHTRKRRYCFIFCTSWKTQSSYWVFLHMGWGSSSYNKWVPLEAYYAITATY